MSRRGWWLFVAMSLIWGIPYLLIKVAVEELTPASLVLLRTALATAVLLPVAAARGGLGALLPRWRPLLAFTLVELAVPWYLLSAAEQRLSSSLTGLLVAAVPLVGAVLGWVAGHEALGARRLTGLFVGLAGVAALVGLDVGSGDLVAIAQVAVVAVGYALGPFILSRWLSDVPGLAVIAVSLAITALLYAPLGIAQMPSAMPSPATVVSVAILALLCTALAFLLFFRLIAEIGPVRSTVITYVNPAVAVLLGVVLLDEPFTTGIAVGFALILAGSYLATRRAPEAARAEAPLLPAPAEC
ncbi:MAG: DMT family transporter [Actinomycetota bacterium]|nr:DMT family transporter [Actinomycetota bacterium]